MNEKLKCTECGQDRDKGRKMCRTCYLKFKREHQKEKYYKEGRYMYLLTCEACNDLFKGFTNKEVLCDKCWVLKKELASQSQSTNSYVYTGYKGKRILWEHRQVAEIILGRKLTTNELVHHVDNNPKNNMPFNLMVLDRRTHVKLHRYLDHKRVIFEKSKNENSENCWNNLILPLTTTWLEITNVKVIKL